MMSTGNRHPTRRGNMVKSLNKHTSVPTLNHVIKRKRPYASLLMQRTAIGSEKRWCGAGRLSVPISAGMCMQCNLICVSLAGLSNVGSQPYSRSANESLPGQRWVLLPLQPPPHRPRFLCVGGAYFILSLTPCQPGERLKKGMKRIQTL